MGIKLQWDPTFTWTASNASPVKSLWKNIFLYMENLCACLALNKIQSRVTVESVIKHLAKRSQFSMHTIKSSTPSVLCAQFANVGLWMVTTISSTRARCAINAWLSEKSALVVKD